MSDSGDARSAFIDSVFWHGSVDRGETILARHPEVRSSDIHTAAMVGDDQAVGRFLALDPAQATATGGPRGVDALTHLCFSAYLREDRGRSDAFVRVATALLDAGCEREHRLLGDESPAQPGVGERAVRRGGRRAPR